MLIVSDDRCELNRLFPCLFPADPFILGRHLPLLYPHRATASHRGCWRLRRAVSEERARSRQPTVRLALGTPELRRATDGPGQRIVNATDLAWNEGNVPKLVELARSRSVSDRVAVPGGRRRPRRREEASHHRTGGRRCETGRPRPRGAAPRVRRDLEGCGRDFAWDQEGYRASADVYVLETSSAKNSRSAGRRTAGRAMNCEVWNMTSRRRDRLAACFGRHMPPGGAGA